MVVPPSRTRYDRIRLMDCHNKKFLCEEFFVVHGSFSKLKPVCGPGGNRTPIYRMQTDCSATKLQAHRDSLATFSIPKRGPFVYAIPAAFRNGACCGNNQDFTPPSAGFRFLYVMNVGMSETMMMSRMIGRR